MQIKKTWTDISGFILLVQRNKRMTLLVLMLCAVTGAAQPFVTMIFSARILDFVIARQFVRAAHQVGWMLGLNFVIGMVNRICTQIMVNWEQTVDLQILMKTNDKAFRMEYEELEKTETKDAISRIQSGINGNGGIGMQIISLERILESLFGCIWSLVFMIHLFAGTGRGSGSFFDSIGAVLILAACYGVILWVSYRISKASSVKEYNFRHSNEHNNAVFTFFGEFISNYQNGKDLRIYRMQRLIEKWMDKTDIQGNKAYIQWSRDKGNAVGADLFMMQIAACLAYLFVGGKAIAGSISIGSVLLYAGAINRLTVNVGDTIREWNDFYYRMQYLKEYQLFLERPDMSYDGTLPVEKRNDRQYEIELDHVSFRYPGSKETVLEDVCFKFEIGKRYALVGRNGAGKTTFIKLLCRLYEPTEGRILLNGIDISLYSYQEYVQIFSVVFQDFKLFAFKLGENVASGGEVDRKKAIRYLKEAGFGERLKSLPEGLETLLFHNIGEGIDLSGGEAQKVAIARALYKDAPFVILDEPTAALDPVAEAEIYREFNQMIQDRTAVYISHRMSSCQFCDEIVVLDGGKIAERGNHQELLKQGGIYARLYQTQAQYYQS